MERHVIDELFSVPDGLSHPDAMVELTIAMEVLALLGIISGETCSRMSDHLWEVATILEGRHGDRCAAGHENMNGVETSGRGVC